MTNKEFFEKYSVGDTIYTSWDSDSERCIFVVLPNMAELTPTTGEVYGIGINAVGNYRIGTWGIYDEVRLATESEIEELSNALKFKNDVSELFETIQDASFGDRFETVEGEEVLFLNRTGFHANFASSKGIILKVTTKGYDWFYEHKKIIARKL